MKRIDDKRAKVLRKRKHHETNQEEAKKDEPAPKKVKTEEKSAVYKSIFKKGPDIPTDNDFCARSAYRGLH